MAQLENSYHDNRRGDLRPAEVQQPEKNVASVVEAFENLLSPLDVKDKEGIYYISSGFCITLHIEEVSLKVVVYGQKMKDKIIRGCLETYINLFDAI